MTLSRKIVRKLRTLYRDAEEKFRWRMWLRSESMELAKDRRHAAAAIEALSQKQLISVIVPVYDIEERFLRRCIESVLNQWYPQLELCIADDRSSAPHVKKVLEEFAKKDQRIKLVFRDTNGGISEASNSAFALATGEFCALLDHDDELSEDALFRVAAEINKSTDIDLLYSDEDKIDQAGKRFDPTFKPDWSRDLFYSLNLLNHLTVYRTGVIRAAGAFRRGFEGSQDYDLTLRVLELISDESIRHIPRVLYHWRALPGSLALAGGEKSYAHERARAALSEHFDRTAIAASVVPAANNWHRVRYKISKPVRPGIFIYGHEARTMEESTRNLRRRVNSKEVEFHQMVCPNGELAASLNAGVSGSKADVLIFVAAGLTPISDDWWEELCSLAMQEPIGAVGAKILAVDETVVGGGLVTGVGNAVEAAHYGLPRRRGGNIGRNIVICNYSAVSVRCMATQRRYFEAIGGFDSTNLPGALFDVDYCLRLGERKRRIVYTPYSELTGSNVGGTLKSPERGEMEYFRNRWSAYIEQDPFYNPNFSKADGRFRIKV